MNDDRSWGRGGAATLLRRLVDVREGEVRALLYSSAFFFCVLWSYFLIKPVRETMGLRGRIDDLSWLYLGRFIPWVYRFFISNLVIFYILEHLVSEAEGPRTSLGYVFFIWLSIFNMFAVAVFRSFMVDIFTNEQGKRLFGFIGVGGTIGALLGSWVSGRLISLPIIGLGELMLISALLLEASVWMFRGLMRNLPQGNADRGVRTEQEPVGLGGAFRAFTLVGRSPYMIGICLFMLCFTVTSTFVWFTRMNFV
jgi:AAA family ATP:ADP antiporter